MHCEIKLLLPFNLIKAAHQVFTDKKSVIFRKLCFFENLLKQAVGLVGFSLGSSQVERRNPGQCEEGRGSGTRADDALVVGAFIQDSDNRVGSVHS